MITDPGEVFNTSVFHKVIQLSKQPLSIPKGGQEFLSCFTLL